MPLDVSYKLPVDCMPRLGLTIKHKQKKTFIGDWEARFRHFGRSEQIYTFTVVTPSLWPTVAGSGFRHRRIWVRFCTWRKWAGFLSCQSQCPIQVCVLTSLRSCRRTELTRHVLVSCCTRYLLLTNANDYIEPEKDRKKVWNAITKPHITLLYPRLELFRNARL